MSQKIHEAQPSGELDAAIARSKSYIGSSILVLVLYLVFWLPGLIANILYYREAQRMEQIGGIRPQGTGCLAIMLWGQVIVVALAVVFGLIALVSS